MTGGLTSSVVSIMQAAPWHAAGITRAGVRVGIIDFFNGDKWTAQQNAGEVPVASGTFCRNSGAACSVWDPQEDGHGNVAGDDLRPRARCVVLPRHPARSATTTPPWTGSRPTACGS